jgi:hypothetical protein
MMAIVVPMQVLLFYKNAQNREIARKNLKADQLAFSRRVSFIPAPHSKKNSTGAKSRCATQAESWAKKVCGL